MADSDASNSSIPSLLRNLREDTTALLRQEAALIKAELGVTVRDIGKRSISLVVGAVVCLLGAIAIVTGTSNLVTALLVMADVAMLHASWLGPLVVGSVIVAIGAMMITRARKALARDSLLLLRPLNQSKKPPNGRRTKFNL